MPGLRLQAEFDGVPIASLVQPNDPPLLVFEELPSTQDAVHVLGAAGAPSGTVVVAERQRAGRGRQGRSWLSDRPSGVWLTMLDRPDGDEALSVLSLRLGLLIAIALEPLADARPRVKWPNDVHVPSGKLAGILVEARWRDDRPEWVAIGAGINVRPPDGSGEVVLEARDDGSGASHPGAGALREGVRRSEVLKLLLPVLRSAVRGGSRLTEAEVAAWALRDMAAGRRCIAPIPGMVLGISADGLLRILDDDGVERVARSGSLQLAEGRSVGGNA